MKTAFDTKFSIVRPEMDAPKPVKLVMNDSGEQPRHASPLPRSRDRMPTLSDERWKGIYDARAAFAAQDPKQAYLFELDRQTLPAMLSFCTDIPEDKRALRVEQLSKIMPKLNACLRARYEQSVNPDLPEDALLVPFSNIFRLAANKLGQDYGLIGTTLVEFAAGWHRQVVSLPLSSTVEVISEPDSYLVFLFAEFALQCLRSNIDTDMWIAMLPFLVMLQSAYIARWETSPHGAWTIIQYGMPPAASLSSDRFNEIKNEYRTITTQAALEAKIFQNLHDAGNNYS